MADSSDIAFILFLKLKLAHLDDVAYKSNKEVWEGPVRAARSNKWVMLTTNHDGVMDTLPKFDLIEVIYGESWPKGVHYNVVSFRRRVNERAKKRFRRKPGSSMYTSKELGDVLRNFDLEIRREIVSIARRQSRTISTSKGTENWEPIGPLHGLEDPMAIHLSDSTKSRFDLAKVKYPLSCKPETASDASDSSVTTFDFATSFSATTRISVHTNLTDTEQFMQSNFTGCPSVADFMSRCGVGTGGGKR
jgi:hypothetical protein